MKNERELIQQLKGRAEFCRDRGEVKTPELLERAIKALEQREGYKLVPVVDSDAMWSAGMVIIEGNGYCTDASNVYKAMIGVTK